MLDGGTTQDAFDDCICHCKLVAHSHSYQRIHAAYYASNRELAPCGFSDIAFGLPEGNLAGLQRLHGALAIGADALVTHDRDFSAVRDLRVLGVKK